MQIYLARQRSCDNISPMHIQMLVIWGCISLKNPIFCCQTTEQLLNLIVAHNILNSNQQLLHSDA